jgi:CRISPR-associated protein Cmr4
MNNNSIFLLTYYTLTPLHMGSGSSVSHIDLPIQRERHSSFPMMAASGIKGVFRNQAERIWNNKNEVDMIFGPEDGSNKSSCISFTDARILLYPVRSVRGIFAWITCPFVLKRFKEDLKSIGINNANFNVPDLSQDTKIIVSNNSLLKIDNNNSKVGLEEFVFEVENNDVNNIINLLKRYLPIIETISDLEKKLAVVSDNVFTDLVNYATEIRTRIRIDPTRGVVSEGALFTLEMVPSDAIFYSLLFVNEAKSNGSSSEQKNINSTTIDTDNIDDKINKLFNGNNKETVLQFGGDETIGLGFTKVRLNKN